MVEGASIVEGSEQMQLSCVVGDVRLGRNPDTKATLLIKKTHPSGTRESILLRCSLSSNVQNDFIHGAEKAPELGTQRHGVKAPISFNKNWAHGVFSRSPI